MLVRFTLLLVLSCTLTRAQSPIDSAILREQIGNVTDLRLSVSKKDSLLNAYRAKADSVGNRSLVAYCEHRLGVLYFASDDFDNAYPHYAKSVKLQKLLPQVDTLSLLRSALWAGKSALRLGKPELAKAYFREVITFPTQRYVVMAYGDMSEVYWIKGDYTQAEEYAAKAFEEQGLLKTGDLLQLQINYLGLKQDEGNDIELPDLIAESEVFLDTIRRHIGSDGIDRENLVKFLQNLALLCDNNGDKVNSVKYNTIALQYAKGVTRAGLYNNLGNLTRRSGDIDQAEEYLRKAQHIYRTEDDRFGLARTSDNFGEIFLAKKDFLTAQVYFDSAVFYLIGNHFAGDTKSITPLQGDKKMSLAIYMKDKAWCLHQWYEDDNDFRHLDTALICYTYADEVLDLVRRSLARDESQLQWRSKAREIYEPAVSVAIEAGREDLALKFLDRGKALVLTEALQKNRIAEAVVPDSLRGLTAALSRQINRLDQKRYKLNQSPEESKDALSRVQDSLLETQEAYIALNNTLLKNYPDYFPDYTFDLSAIQAALSPDQCILSYFLTKDTVLCGRVDSSGLVFQYLGSRKYLDSLMNELNDLMAEMETHSVVGNSLPDTLYTQHLKRLADCGYALNRLLLSSWEKLPGHIMIVGDDRLNELNFEMLLTEKPDLKTHLYRWPFAIKKYCFTYNHSILNWLELLKNNGTSRNVVGIAPAFGHKYGSLTYSQDGLQDIAGFPVRILAGPQATRGNISALGPNAIVDFQTHAVIANQSEHSFVLLNTPGGALDSLLLRDIYLMRFPGAFVILTACETNVGEIARGEGIISLARAFTYAGASGLITSLWKVDDYASSIIIKLFYKALAKQLDKDVALREAKLTYLSHRQNELEEHPFYWASLIHIGNAAPIPSRNYRIFYGIGAALGLLCMTLLIRRSLKRQSLQRAT